MSGQMGIKSGKITATSSVWPVEDGGRVMLKLDAAAVGTSPSLGRRWIIAGLPLACWSRDHTITGDLACFNSFGFDCFVNTEQWVCAERALRLSQGLPFFFVPQAHKEK